jgi:hypothetical protein
MLDKPSRTGLAGMAVRGASKTLVGVRDPERAKEFGSAVVGFEGNRFVAAARPARRFPGYRQPAGNG